MSAVGIYVSVPFCKSKCSYCNFASGVFSRAKMAAYVARVAGEVERSQECSARLGTELSPECNSIYLGGGTPSTLDPELFAQIFSSIRSYFRVTDDAEITIECAPGTISDELLQTMLRQGVSRISFGVQSFADQETRAVARLHTRQQALEDIRRVRDAGIQSISIDLIAGLPHQTAASWRESVEQAIETGVPHVSVYMLEVDEDSRLGTELMAGGTRYHAHFVPDDDAIADFYVEACERLQAAGIAQYEISNFSRPGHESLHNLKYWTRQPYLGFGLDAHSMHLAAHPNESFAAVRCANADDLDRYLEGTETEARKVSQTEAIEEEFFLGLRLNQGISIAQIEARFAPDAARHVAEALPELIAEGLLEQTGQSRVRLTSRGRLLSNEVFARLLHDQAKSTEEATI